MQTEISNECIPAQEDRQEWNYELTFLHNDPENQEYQVDQQDIGIGESQERRDPEFRWTHIRRKEGEYQ